jgi:hypothetical protein
MTNEIHHLLLNKIDIHTWYFPFWDYRYQLLFSFFLYFKTIIDYLYVVSVLSIKLKSHSPKLTVKIQTAILFFFSSFFTEKTSRECMCNSDGRKKIQLLSNSKINKQFWKSKISISKNLLIKITMDKSPNEISNYPFAPSCLRHWLE